MKILKSGYEVDFHKPELYALAMARSLVEANSTANETRAFHVAAALRCWDQLVSDMAPLLACRTAIERRSAWDASAWIADEPEPVEVVRTPDPEPETVWTYAEPGSIKRPTFESPDLSEFGEPAF